MSLKVSSQFFVSFTLIHQKFANHYLTRSHLNVKAHILPLIHVRNSHRSRWECCTEINDRIWTSRLDHLSHGSSSHWHTEIWEDWEKKKTKRHKAESFQDKLHGSLVKLAVNWMLTVVLQKWKRGGRWDCKAANFGSDALGWDFMSHHSGEQDLFYHSFCVGMTSPSKPSEFPQLWCLNWKSKNTLQNLLPVQNMHDIEHFIASFLITNDLKIFCRDIMLKIIL